MHFVSGSGRRSAIVSTASGPSALQAETAAVQFSNVELRDVIAAAMQVPAANIPEIQLVLVLTLEMACKKPADLDAAVQPQIIGLIKSAGAAGVADVAITSSSVDLGRYTCLPQGSRRTGTGTQATGTFNALIVPQVRLQAL